MKDSSVRSLARIYGPLFWACVFACAYGVRAKALKSFNAVIKYQCPLLACHTNYYTAVIRANRGH
jgi:hypothetical protein